MNFSFLNPLFLIGLLAVALPVIAHLISRKSGVKKSFSAVNFLLASQGEAAKRSKLKDLSLLLLRSLILVLIVLVFSKPAVFSFSSVDVREPRSVAIVVDNSFSMGYGDNFKSAKGEAERLIKSLADGSFGGVFPLVETDDTRPEVTQYKGKIMEDLKNLKLSNSFADNERRLEEVFGFLRSTPGQKKEVIFVSDFQKNGWTVEDFRRKWLTPVDVAPGLEMENRCISRVDFKDQEDSIKIVVTVSNHSKVSVDNLLATVSLGGREINSFFGIEPEGKETKEFIFPKGKVSGGEMPGKVQISNDSLKVDDIRYFILSQTEGLRVLIVDGDPRQDARLGETYYLARAVETISEVLPLNLSIKDNDAFLDDELKGYDLIFLANAGDVTPQKSREMEEFLKSGGAVVVFLGDRVVSNTYNTLLRTLPAELGAVSDGDYFLSADKSNKSLAEMGEKLGRVEVKRLFNLRAAQDSQVILSSSSNSPFLVRRGVGDGSVFLFASTADTSWTNFPLSPVFLPTIKDIFDFTHGTRSKKRNFKVGDSVEIEFLKEADEIKVRNPSGETFKVSKENPKFSETPTPGIYGVEEGGKFTYSFAINVDPRESDLQKISLETVSTQADVKKGLVKVFDEIWGYFLWGVIALFLSESVFRALSS